MPRRKGRWVFVPLPKWETDPTYYSIRKSQIACQLFLRDIRPDLYDYCIENEVMPPERLRKWRLEKWIEDHRQAARAIVPIAELKGSSNARRGAEGRKQGRGAVLPRKPKNRRSKIRLETF